MGKKRKQRSLNHPDRKEEQSGPISHNSNEPASTHTSPKIDPSSKQTSRKRRRTPEKSRKPDTTDTTCDSTKSPTTHIKDPKESGGVTTHFPYPTEEDDHCESPFEAYRDVKPILEAIKACISSSKQQTGGDLQIYDPYYCDGAAAINLTKLGFPHVYHRKEDCYQVWRDPTRLPTFDAIVTNPPYSADHIERLIEFITSPVMTNKTWLLLLPNWVVKKDYYANATKNIRPFYIVPHKKYIYKPPDGFREKKQSDVHKKSSPFISMWYVWGGHESTNEQLIRRYMAASRHGSLSCDLARSKSALRDLRRKKR